MSKDERVAIAAVPDLVRHEVESVDPIGVPLHGGKLHNAWELSEAREDGYSWINRPRGLVVIVSAARYQDGKLWLHLSVSKSSAMPRYEDLAYVKRQFFGDDFKVIMVLPEKRYHVNIHPNCLHLYHCLDEGGDPLPEFSLGMGTI